jgi:hypothetical protein
MIRTQALLLSVVENLSFWIVLFFLLFLLSMRSR